MATFASASKSNRLLQSKRYTIADSDSQEAYTNVLDLNASEIYTQQNAITSSGIPYSGSSQDGLFLTSGSDNISRYFFRHQLSPTAVRVNTNRYNTFFFMSGSGFTPGTEVDPQLIGGGGAASNQLTNFISNKYAAANLAANTAEASSGTAYNVVVFKGSSADPEDGSIVSAGEYQFDYKTGILQFKDNSTAPTTGASDKIFMTAYQYVGKTLADETLGGGGGSGTGFPFSGSAIITGSLLVSGSDVNFSNATSVSLSTFTAQSASIDHLVVNTLISGSTIITSGSNTFGDETSDVQTLIGTTKMTGSAQVTGSLNVDGVFTLPGISNVSSSIASAIAGGGIFNQIGSTEIYNANKSLQVSGSTLQSTPLAHSTNLTSSGASAKYALIVSESVWHRNANVGVPTSNAWKSGLGGSYFENFDHNTDISEILRFVSGLLSSSAPNAVPNTKTYSSISSGGNNGATGTIPDGRVPHTATNQAIAYLESKGFASDGNQLFNGISTVYNNSAYFQDYTSVAAGSTIVSSSVDAQLFGLGSVNTKVQISGGFNFAFESSSAEGIYLQSSSGQIIEQDGAGTTDGLTVGTIVTANPAVIPNAFQDGKFVDAFNVPIKWESLKGNIFTNPSASAGFYHLSASISIATASGAFNQQKDDFDRIFFASSSLDTTAVIPNNTISIGVFTSASIGTATSRSLSGAPYLLADNFKIFNSASGMFNPLYSNRSGGGSPLAQLTTNESDEGVGSPADAGGMSVDLVMNANGTINTTEDVVFNAAGAVARAANDVPRETDTIRLSGSIAFSAASGKTNVDGSGGLSPTTFRVTSTYYNRSNGTSTDTTNFSFHDAGAHGATAASGSMAYYGRAQGYDTSTETGLTERFVGEDTRKQLTDSLLTVTSATAYGETFRLGQLNSKDLQIIPKNSSTTNGLLIKPGGTRKYWIPSTGETYHYYARIFDTSAASQQSSLSIDLGLNSSDVTKWSDTSGTNTVSAIFLLESLTSANKSARGISPTTVQMFDIVQVAGGELNTFTGGTSGTNPFGVDYTVEALDGTTVGNGQSTNTKFTIPMLSPKNMLINATYRKLILLIRYKGEGNASTPISQVEVSIA